MTTMKPLTGTTIRFLQQHSSESVLIERDGFWEALAYLDGDESIVVRSDARRWADELVDAAREAAEDAGTSTALGTLRAAAAREGTAELLAERAREDVVTTPRRSPSSLTGLPTLLLSGRRAAAPTPEHLEAETHALCALLDQLEDAGLVIRAA